jgi:hypothetical protein
MNRTGGDEENHTKSENAVNHRIEIRKRLLASMKLRQVI